MRHKQLENKGHCFASEYEITKSTSAEPHNANAILNLHLLALLIYIKHNPTLFRRDDNSLSSILTYASIRRAPSTLTHA